MSSVVLRGRANEMALVVSAMRHVVETGRSALVLVQGVPGIGKSALLGSAIEQMEEAGFQVGVSKVDEVEQIALGAPLLLALRSGEKPLVDRALFESLEPVYDRYIWLLERIAVILEDLAGTAPVVVAIDDIHWADRLTGFALRTLPSRLANSQIVWLLSSRLSNHDVVDEVVTAAGDSVAVTRLVLDPLTEEDIDELAGDRLGAAPVEAVRTVLRGVGGNPFWAVQQLDKLARRRPGASVDSGPPAVLSVGVTLTDLSEETLDLVRVVSVWGRTLSYVDAAGLLNQPVPTVSIAVREAEDNGLLDVDGLGVSMPHDLIREAVYADTPLATRLRWHRVCARYLSSIDVTGVAAAAHYRVLAKFGDLEAADALMRAADSSANGIPDQAADLAVQAFGLVPSDHPRWLEIGHAALELLVRVQREPDAVAVADRLIDRAPDEDTMARLQVLAGRALWETGDCRQMERRSDSALKLPNVTRTTRAQLHAVRALAATRTDSALTADDQGTFALREGRDVGDEFTVRVSLLALAEAARNAGRHQVVYDRLVEVHRTSDVVYRAEEVRALQHLDRYPEADALLADIRHGANNDFENVLPNVMWAQIWQDHNLGRFEAAVSAARSLLRVAEQLGNYMLELNARMILCAVAVYRGDLADARAVLDPLETRRESRDSFRATRLRAIEAWLDAEEGNLDASVRVLQPLLATAGDGCHAWPWSPPWMRAFVKIGIAAGSAVVVDTATGLAVTAAERNPGVMTLQGVVAQIRGLAGGDVACLEQAVTLLRKAPRPLLLADALGDLGEMYLATAQRALGVQAVQEAVDRFESLGAVGRAAPLRQVLVRNGARRPDKAPTPLQPPRTLPSLTEAEMRVARVVASGHSSQSAAAQLNVSVNTVNSHLRSIFMKLDVRSRVQLANLLHERDVTMRQGLPGRGRGGTTAL
jgi:DNA-binding CsgD family transcriptional regulator/nucleoside-triphosphatase THEP1